MINKKSKKQKAIENEFDLIDFVEIHMLRGIDTDAYKKEINSVDIGLLWDALHGYGVLSLELPYANVFDYSSVPDDRQIILLLGSAIFHKAFELNHIRHISTICNEEPDLTDALDAMLVDLRSEWDPKSCTLNSYLKDNWQMVVFFKNDDQFGIPVKWVSNENKKNG